MTQTEKIKDTARKAAQEVLDAAASTAPATYQNRITNACYVVNGARFY